MPKMITVKQCVTQASKEIGISQKKSITSAINTTDQDIIQMVALLENVADEVLLEEPYRTSLGDGIWLLDAQGDPKQEISADTDLIAFDSRLAINGVKYRFLKAKGLEFGEELRDFTTRMNKLAVRVNGRVLDLDTDEGRQL